MRRILVVLSFVLVGGTAVMAQTASPQTPAPKKKTNHNTYGSPLDTIMSTHLWTDVGQPKDFVRESRPDPKSLDYTPVTGTDPDRPKPRDAANVQALQAELEHDLVRNEARGDHSKKAARAAKQSAKVRNAVAQPAE